MEIVATTQGSEHWHKLRAARYTASEAPVMMGASSKSSRNDLLRMKSTGHEKEFSEWVQRNVLDKGHEYEEAARPIAEKIVGDELFRAVVIEEVRGLPLLASCDGLGVLGECAYEHKQPNKELWARVAEHHNAIVGGDTGRDLGEHAWQLEHQLLVTRADRVLFMVSDGTEENAVWCFYESVPERRERLIAGWEQFHADLQSFEPKDPTPEPVGKAPEDLPALRIEVSGEVRDSNLDAFKEHAESVIQSINTDLQTDDDFADADKTVKWCKEVEQRLEAAKEHALSQTESIDRLFRTINEIRQQARQKRLELDKLVKARKESIRNEIVQQAKHDLDEYIASLEHPLSSEHGVSVCIDPLVGRDFAGAIKGKKTVKSVQDAADAHLADKKVEAKAWADHLGANLRRLTNEMAYGHMALFPDAANLAAKPAEDMEAIAKERIAEHEAEQQRRQEAERQEREAEPAEIKQPTADAADDAEPATSGDEPRGWAQYPEPEEGPRIEDDGTRLKLSEINAIIAPLSINGTGLSELGFDPVGREKAAKLYRASDLPTMLQAIARHIHQQAQSHQEAA